MPPIFLSTVDARDSFSRLVDRAALGKDRIVVTRHGEPMVAIVPLEDLELLEDLERHLARRHEVDPDAVPLYRRERSAEAVREQIRLWE